MELCRICLRKGANVRLFEILEYDLSLALKYVYCTSIQINKRDNFEDVVCVNCVQELNDFYVFKLQAEKSNRFLKSSLVCQKNDIAENTSIESHLQNSSANTCEESNNQTKIQCKTVRTTGEIEYLFCNNNNITDKELIPDEKKKAENAIQMQIKDSDDKFELTGKVQMKEKRNKKIKKHMCDTCGKTFFDPYGLTLHKRCHTGVRPYKCHMCSHEFTQHHNMLRHISAKHYKERRYQCELCPAMFAYSSSLREHLQVHNGHKGHVCPTCGKQFSKRFGLSRHLVTHTDIKPFKCKDCDKSYTQSNDLKTHIKKMHISSTTEVFFTEMVSSKC